MYWKYHTTLHSAQTVTVYTTYVYWIEYAKQIVFTNACLSAHITMYMYNVSHVQVQFITCTITYIVHYPKCKKENQIEEAKK